jgi:hypothetical protein
MGIVQNERWEATSVTGSFEENGTGKVTVNRSLKENGTGKVTLA